MAEIDGRGDCFGAIDGTANTEGRMRRRRSVSGMVVAALSVEVVYEQKFEIADAIANDD